MQHGNGVFGLGIGSACHPGSEVGRLHCAGSASANHQVAPLCQFFADTHNLFEAVVGTQKSVPAHNAYNFFLVVSVQKIV